MSDNYDYGFGYDWGYDTPYLDQEADLPLALDPSGKPSWDFQFTGLGQLLKSLGGDTSSGSALKAIGSILGGGGAGAFLGSAGIGALLNRLSGGSGSQAPVGYQGGIPQYTIERAQTPIAQQRPAGYRPGQGGITYFAPTKYTPTGKDLGAPVSPATGGTTGGTTGGSTVGIDTGGSVATPGYTGPVTIDGIPIALYDPPPKNFGPTGPMAEGVAAASGGAMPSGIAMLAKGRYIQGNGDGVSDSVPAQFVGSKRPAALSDGEFVFPARIVAELGNGSNKAGAKKLYAFMDRVEARAKSAKRGKPSGADKDLSRLA